MSVGCWGSGSCSFTCWTLSAFSAFIWMLYSLHLCFLSEGGPSPQFQLVSSADIDFMWPFVPLGSDCCLISVWCRKWVNRRGAYSGRGEWCMEGVHGAHYTATGRKGRDRKQFYFRIRWYNPFFMILADVNDHQWMLGTYFKLCTSASSGVSAF